MFVPAAVSHLDQRKDLQRGNITWIIFSMSCRDSIFSGHRAECAAPFPLCARVRHEKGVLTFTSVLNGFNFTRLWLEILGFYPQKLKAPCGSVAN